MAEIINMPRLSDTMEEGTVASWLKKVGDKVAEGDILAEIETDKATMEFESFHDGTLLYIGVKEGETSKVDALLAIIGKEGEDISNLIENANNDENVIIEKDSEKSATQNKAGATTTIVPEGVQIITMPRLSDTMEEGTVSKWIRNVGDHVEEGDILAEIETDKATMEFESFHSGVLLHIGLKEGESAKVDALLAILGPQGTDVSAIAANYTLPTQSRSEDQYAEKEISKSNKSVQEVNQNVKKDINVTASPNRIYVSPLAKKMAKEKGINIAHIKGTGEKGRVIKRDIENYNPSAIQSKVSTFVPAGQENYIEIPNSQMRKTIARRLTESKYSAPHYYLNVEFNMENAIAFRQQFNSIPDTKISYNDIVVKACAMALKLHPQVNSQWYEDRMKLNNHVHIGVAVAVEDGLLVPVVRFANEMTLPQIGSAVKEYAVKARNKKLTPDEMEGSTFTISNLGMFGIESFTSIINQPNSAILSVGSILQKPVVKDGKLVVGNIMKLTMACDHRTVDGVTGSAFLQTLKNYIENPVTMLV